MLGTSKTACVSKVAEKADWTCMKAAIETHSKKKHWQKTHTKAMK